MIQKCKPGDAQPGKDWCLYSQDGEKLLGRGPTEESMEDREREVEYFKHNASRYVAEAQRRHTRVSSDRYGAVDTPGLLKAVEEALRAVGKVKDQANKEGGNQLRGKDRQFDEMWGNLVKVEQLLEQAHTFSEYVDDDMDEALYN